MNKKQWLGSSLLMSAAFIWGSSFVVMKNAVESISPFSILWIRFSIAAIGTSLICFKYIKKVTKKQILYGAIAGALLFSAYSIQTWGLSLTTPSKNAFLTAIYCAIIPFLVWIFDKQRPDMYNFIAAILSFIGIGFVCLTESLTMQWGDILTILSGLFFGLHIVIIKRYTREVHPITLTIWQFIFTAIYAGIIAILFEDISLITTISSSNSMQILYLAIFATIITLLCQSIGQEMISACSGAIILSLEAVFGVLFSVMLYHETITPLMVIGFVCIFTAIIISETKLSFIKRRNTLGEENNTTML